MAKGRQKGKGGLTEEKGRKSGSGEDFLNVRLTAWSNTLRTWRSGPHEEPGKNFRIFSKRRLTLRELLAISPSPLMGTELIGSRSFHRQQGAARPKPSRSLRARKERTKIFEILTLKDNQRVTTKIELWVIVSSFLCDINWTARSVVRRS